MVLSRHELEQRAADPEYLGPRRATRRPPPRRELARAELFGVMESLLERFNAIARGAGPLTNPVDVAYQLSVLRESSHACLA